MPDFFQQGPITTIHDLRTSRLEQLEEVLRVVTRRNKIGLVLPVTAADMRAPAFDRIAEQLQGADYIDTTTVVLGKAPEVDAYHETFEKIKPLGERGHLLWTDGPRFQALFAQLTEAGFPLGSGGKGLSVWTAFGYLMADPTLSTYALHDCDIVDYDRLLLARLCLPMAHPGMDYEFCKAYYARVTNQMNGRVVRLLIVPFLSALKRLFPNEKFIEFLSSFRYPLAGEFSMTANLARSNRIPSDWGLEVGTLAEVFRNTSVKRVCQVDLCRLYEHKHQQLSLEDRTQGLMKMATDILTTIYRTLSSRGVVFEPGHFVTLRAAYLREAQDAIRQYNADAVLNDLRFDRHSEEQAVEGFAEQVMQAGQLFREDPAGAEAIPNWTRVLTAFPEFPHQLREAVAEDRAEYV